MIDVESPALPVGLRAIHTSSSSRNVPHQTRRSEKGIYSHIWELVSYLPRAKATVDILLQHFLDELNPIYDSIHEESFRFHYEAFWNRRWGDDDLTSIDLRWLSLLFMVLAFGEILDCPQDCSPERQRECEEASIQFFWAARKTIVLAPTFAGESPDLVRAGILVSRYLVYLGRKNESWLTCSFAIRMAQGQGMHIDGESWGLPPKLLETRRRLWSTLYTFDRSISLAIGRPYTINDKHSMEMKIRNVWLDDMPQDEASTVVEYPLSQPTPSVFFMYQQKIAAIMGDIHDDCFGLSSQDTSNGTYEKVLNLDRKLNLWADSLPPYFHLKSPDRTMDQSRPYLSWQRMYIHTAYHFTRVTLHRTFVFLDSMTDRYKYSREACIDSACADLALKLASCGMRSAADRLRDAPAMHRLFNSALVLGIIVVRDPVAARTPAMLNDLTAYCEKQTADCWANEFVLAEVKVIELCISSARKSRGELPAGNDVVGSGIGKEIPGEGLNNIDGSTLRSDALPSTQVLSEDIYELDPRSERSNMSLYTLTSEGPDRADICGNWLDSWFGPNRNFPEPMDYQLWEDLVVTLEPGEGEMHG